MKKINLLLLGVLVLFAGFFGSCKKDEDDENTFDFFGGSYIDADVTVAPGASLPFKFTASTTTKMSYIEIEMTGYGVVWDEEIPSASDESYTKEVTLTAPSNPGTYTYNFVIYDNDDNELISKSIVVTVSATANFSSYTGKLLYVPSAGKTSMTYFASSTGDTYSYNGIGTNSSKVDWGYYYGTTAKHTFFALTDQPSLGYDITSWTKNATKFKKLTGVNFANTTTSAAIETAVGTIGTSGVVDNLAVNDVIGFRTAAGKYGLILITAKSADSNAEGTNITFSVKVQQ